MQAEVQAREGRVIEGHALAGGVEHHHDVPVGVGGTHGAAEFHGDHAGLLRRAHVQEGQALLHLRPRLHAEQRAGVPDAQHLAVVVEGPLNVGRRRFQGRVAQQAPVQVPVRLVLLGGRQALAEAVALAGEVEGVEPVAAVVAVGIEALGTQELVPGVAEG